MVIECGITVIDVLVHARSGVPHATSETGYAMGRRAFKICIGQISGRDEFAHLRREEGLCADGTGVGQPLNAPVE